MKSIIIEMNMVIELTKNKLINKFLGHQNLPNATAKTKNKTLTTWKNKYKK